MSERRARRTTWTTVALAVVALASIVSVGFINYREHEKRAALTAPVPHSLVTTNYPSPTSAPPQATTESSASAPPTQKPTTSVATTSPQPAVIVKAINPVHLFIPSIGVNTTISPGQSSWQYDPHTGHDMMMFPVPNDLYTVTWWQGGPDANGNFAAAPQPGSSGVAIFTMHSSLDNQGYGVGNHLGDLKRGMRIGVEGADQQGHKTLLSLTVLKVPPQLDKTDPNALRDAILAAPKGTRAIFVTCSGSVSWDISSSNFNTVVYAGLVSAGSA